MSAYPSGGSGVVADLYLARGGPQPAPSVGSEVPGLFPRCRSARPRSGSTSRPTGLPRTNHWRWPATPATSGQSTGRRFRGNVSAPHLPEWPGEGRSVPPDRYRCAPSELDDSLLDDAGVQPGRGAWPADWGPIGLRLPTCPGRHGV